MSARRAALYARVSTREQAENNHSLDSQGEKFRAYCALHGLAVAGEYVDSGHSGTTEKRPALARLLIDIEASLIDIVVVYKLDRFARNLRVLFGLVHILETHAVALVSITEPFDTSTPAGRAMLGMLGTFGQFERDTFMERSKDGMRQAVTNGMYTGGIVAYGYRVKEQVGTAIEPGGADAATGNRARKRKNSRLEIDPTEAEIVRRIFRWAAEGQTTYAIAVRLNASGTPTKYTTEGRGVRGKATANLWRAGRVRNMLANPAYKGQWLYGKCNTRREQQGGARNNVAATLTPGTVPAIVDAELWQRAHDALRRNQTFSPRNGKREYLLSGLIWCSCGYAYCGCYYDLIDGSEVRYYRCAARTSRAPRLGNPCGNPSIRVDFIEPLVWGDIRGFLEQPDNVIEALRAIAQQGVVDHTDELGRIEKKLKELEDAEAKLVALYTGSAMRREALDREASRIETERRGALRVKAEIERDRANDEAERLRMRGVEQMLKDMRASLAEPTFEQQRDVIRALVSRIVIGMDSDRTPTVKITYAFDGDTGASTIGTAKDSSRPPAGRGRGR